MEITENRNVITAKEFISDREVFFNYETSNTNALPTSVSFSSQGQDGKMFSGSCSQGGHLSFNGIGITEAEDFPVIEKGFLTSLKILKGEL